MVKMIENSYYYNFPAHSGRVLYRYRRLPKLARRYSKALSILSFFARSSYPREKVLYFILKTSSEPEVQYALLLHYYKCLGIKLPSHNNYKKISHEEAKTILEMYSQNFSIYQIAKTLNRHPSTIYYFLKKNDNRKR